ncbi:MAG: hypothetical protein CL840_10295 [Crocinitomicaceae bacterium]|nr:hypothetical protein [Crocinitomicaceae bacterium]|tara:strand:+ start:11633 stop:12640 length:1008 start_codon:yes stop_codon:yes gene_type:complete
MNLVTGSTGIVGSQLVLDLLKKGEEVTAFKRKSSNLTPIKNLFKRNQSEDLYQKIKWYDGDIVDIGSISDSLKGIKRIFHCAALVSFDPRDKDKMEAININGTANIVNAAIENNVNQLIYVSSTAAIGKQKKGVTIDEKCNWDAGTRNSFYSYTKYYSELEVWRGSEEGLNVSVVNPGVIIGTGEWGKSSTNVFKTVWNGLKFYSRGSNAFVDVRDVSRIMIELAEKKIFNERFLLISENMTFKRFFELISSSLGKKPPSILASRAMSSIAWRANWLWSLISNSKPLITRETAHAGNAKQVYSNQKIRDAIGIELITVHEAVDYTAQIFLEENSK